MAEQTSSGDGDTHELDLLLMSNYKDIHVRHYVLNLSCDLDSKRFVGYITLLNEVSSNETSDAANVMPSLAGDDIFNDTPHRNVSVSKSEISQTQLEMTNSSSCALSSERSTDDYTDSAARAAYSVVPSCEITRNLDSNVTVGSCPDGDRAFKLTHTDVNTNISFKEHVDATDQVVTSPTPVMQEGGHVFVMVLDCWDLNVIDVEEIASDPGISGIPQYDAEHKFDDAIVVDDRRFVNERSSETTSISGVSTNYLNYSCEKNCIRIWKDGVDCAKDFPRCVRISYSTSPGGHSLKWTKDQDDKPCVYTHGHWINNRSLFPSQDVPGAMATWRASIRVPQGMVVLMSGDTDPIVTHVTPGFSTFVYHTSMTMPSSTLALAVGYWVQANTYPETDHTYFSRSNNTSYSYCTSSHGTVIPWRLFAPRKHTSVSEELFTSYMPGCMDAASRLLGAHPFTRLDILVVPASFASLGMASPSLMFISQSVLSPDKGMLVRLAHELSHSWFGLLIGPRDWTEEWLSEGFCTYTESIIHDVVMEVNDDTSQQLSAIRDYLKYKTLEAEIQSTGEHLQTLRSGCDPDSADRVEYVKNGMNPDKGFMQLHYLKGYFLLVHLEHLVGRDEFFRFLRLFVRQFNRQLISSKDVFLLFLETFPGLRESGITEDALMTEWLDRPGLPPVDVQLTTSNTLATHVFQMVERIADFNKTYSKLHWRKRRKLDIHGCLRLQKVGHVQTLLLIHKLSEEPRLHPDILCAIDTTLQLSSSNADVLHGWCDLVIKHRVEPHYKDVHNFLLHHQAMGVYLFGEMILAKDQRLRTLAEDCFKTLQDDMEDGVLKTIRSMVFGY